MKIKRFSGLFVEMAALFCATGSSAGEYSSADEAENILACISEFRD